MKHFILTLCLCCSLQAQKTLALEQGMASPPATLAEMAWMEGHWKGEAFGGITEEIWSPAAGGSMMFVFRLLVDDGIQFYEIGHVRELEGTLWFELKHFGADLKGWEEKDEVQRFPLVKVGDHNTLYFDGFTFEKLTDHEINIHARIADAQGETEEVTFHYKKQ